MIMMTMLNAVGVGPVVWRGIRSTITIVNNDPEASLYAKAVFNVMELSDVAGVSLADHYVCLCFKVTEIGVIQGEENRIRRECRISNVDGSAATGYLVCKVVQWCQVVFGALGGSLVGALIDY